MISETQSPPSWSRLSLLSLIASVLGSLIAALIFAALHAPFTFIPLATLFYLYFALFGCVPVGLAIGIPLTALTHRYISRHLLLTTLAFGIIGLLGGVAIKHFGGTIDLGNAELLFGSCIGGMHPLVHTRANGASWRRITAAFLFSAAAIPLVGYAGEDVSNLIESKSEFETRCADLYGSMAVVRDRADLERAGEPGRVEGKWRNQLKWRSLYGREDIFPINKTQVLIARDYAYVPSGIGGSITGGRRVARHCLSEKNGHEAEMLRARGFGKRPDLKDLAD